MVGVRVRPVTPPDCFMGPVCRALMPIWAKASHRAGSPRVARTDSPSRVMMAGGYEENQTEAISAAALGRDSIYGRCHMLPWPEKLRANLAAALRTEWSSSQEM